MWMTGERPSHVGWVHPPSPLAAAMAVEARRDTMLANFICVAETGAAAGLSGTIVAARAGRASTGRCGGGEVKVSGGRWVRQK